MNKQLRKVVRFPFCSTIYREMYPVESSEKLYLHKEKHILKLKKHIQNFPDFIKCSTIEYAHKMRKDGYVIEDNGKLGNALGHIENKCDVLYDKINKNENLSENDILFVNDDLHTQ